MLIVCPKCFTQYLISDEITLSKNQKFHCSTCHNYFTQKTEIREEDSYKTADKSGRVGEKELDLTSTSASLNATKTSDQIFSDSKEAEPNRGKSESLFSEPLDLLGEEKPAKENRLDSIPEEFKPVNPPKKTSLLIVFIWLLIACGICFAAYYQKDFLIAQIDSLILNQLEGGLKTPSRKELSPANSAQAFKSNVVSTTETTAKKLSSVSMLSDQIKEEKQLLNKPESNVQKVQNAVVLPEIQSPEKAEQNITKDTEKGKTVSENSGSQQEVTDKSEKNISVQPLANSEGTLTSSALVQNDINLKNILKIQEISYEISPNEVGVERLMIRGEIANTELKEVSLPEFRAIVYDEQDNVVSRKRIIIEQNKLAGNSTLPFSTAVVPAPKTISRVEVIFDE